MPRPFERSYAVSLTTAVLALVPYIILTIADDLFRKPAADLKGWLREGRPGVDSPAIGAAFKTSTAER